MVLAEMFREKRLLDRQQREKEKFAEGQAETQALWEAWNNRRIQAKKNNLPFTEPTPSLEE